jgi:DNA-binding LacI/PurR family transcriptional regulator
MHHLINLQHQEIGIITSPQEDNFAIEQRLKGLRTGAAELARSINEFPVAFGNFSTQSGSEAAHKLLSDHPHLTGIIALNDRMAIGAIQYIHEQGLSVPDDISVVGFDNLPLTEVFNPAITTIDQHGEQLGMEAAKLLLALLTDASNSSHVVLSPTLIERASSANPRA